MPETCFSNVSHAFESVSNLRTLNRLCCTHTVLFTDNKFKTCSIFWFVAHQLTSKKSVVKLKNDSRLVGEMQQGLISTSSRKLGIPAIKFTLWVHRTIEKLKCLLMRNSTFIRKIVKTQLEPDFSVDSHDQSIHSESGLTEMNSTFRCLLGGKN